MRLRSVRTHEDESNVSLRREQAERLTGKAIREGKNLEALVGEILEAEAESE